MQFYSCVREKIQKILHTPHSQNDVFSSQKGQTLLVVVLVMVVALTVGLSVVLRSIINVRTTTEDENSQRAFSAAEAGIEKLSKQSPGSSITNQSIGDPNTLIRSAAISSFTSNSFLVNGGLPVPRNDGVDVWFSNQDHTCAAVNPTCSSPRFFITWDPGKSTADCSSATNPPAAIEVIVVGGTVSNPTVTHYGFDPCASRQSSNNFSNTINGATTINGVTFPWRTNQSGANSVDVSNPTFFVRIIPLYNNAIIGVSTCNPGGGGCTSLPTQGTEINSTGISGNTQRKILVFQPFPKLPNELLQYLLFVPTHP